MTRSDLARLAAWCDTAEVIARLGCSRTYLREMMEATPDGIVRPWILKGRGVDRRTRYSWEVARVDQRTADSRIDGRDG